MTRSITNVSPRRLSPCKDLTRRLTLSSKSRIDYSLISTTRSSRRLRLSNNRPKMMRVSSQKSLSLRNLMKSLKSYNKSWRKLCSGSKTFRLKNKMQKRKWMNYVKSTSGSSKKRSNLVFQAPATTSKKSISEWRQLKLKILKLSLPKTERKSISK